MELRNMELEVVRKELIEMGVLVHRCTGSAINVLLEREPKIASKVLDDCSKVEALEIEIERRCETVFQSQLMDKKEIGFAVAFLKIAAELKEIACASLDIAKISKSLIEGKLLNIPMDIPHMRQICQEMLVLNLESLRSLNASGLIALSEYEELVDGLCDQIRRVLITNIIEDPRGIRNAEHFKFIANHLERIGDHNFEIGRRLLSVFPHLELKMSNCSPVESLQKG